MLEYDRRLEVGVNRKNTLPRNIVGVVDRVFEIGSSLAESKLMKSQMIVLLMASLITMSSRSWTQQTRSMQQASAAKELRVPPPPMGWSSWNSFSNRVNSQIVMEQAKALVSSGLAQRGYRYVNIDEGWWLGKRDREGNIVVSPDQWPAIAPEERAGDMANIVRYIHGLGLKAGIYTDVGEDGCSFYGPDLGPKMPHTGSEGHYEQDFLQFAQWGFDYVKVDWCGGSSEKLDPATQYAEIGKAIRTAEGKTGYALYYSICNWGVKDPWTWAPGIGGVAAGIWRTSGDIVAPIVADSPNANRRASFEGMLGNFDKGIHPEAQHTGFYNDPDMMVLGMPGLTNEQNRVHMTLWAISGAPLILGADLTKLTPESIAILSNQEVVSIDQDPLGLQAVRISGSGSKVEVWVKKLAASAGASGRRAVVVLNRSSKEQQATIEWQTIGLERAAATVHDVWTNRDVKHEDEGFTITVPAGDASMLVIEGRQAPETKYEAFSDERPAGESQVMEWRTNNVTAAGKYAWVRITYSNAGSSPVLMQLNINGERESVIAFSPTGGNDPRSVTIECNLPRAANEIVFRSDGTNPVKIRSLNVLPIGR